MKALTFYIDRQARFRKFKDDIEERLNDWLTRHPEGGTALAKAKPLKRTGQVLPLDGGWAVYLDGQLVMSFFGDGAQIRATRCLNEILNPGSDTARS